MRCCAGLFSAAEMRIMARFTFTVKLSEFVSALFCRIDFQPLIWSCFS